MNSLPAESSKLFGTRGELWDRGGRLTDFSFAGYRQGEPPPRPPVRASVRDFGAKGDGVTDDTEAFRRAIAETPDGALLIPAGKYVLTDILDITRSHLVLRGEGPDKTLLFFPKGMEQIRPSRSATTSGQPTTAYSWSGGFFWVRGKQKGPGVGRLAARSPRGSRVIELDREPKVQPGDRIEITQEDPGDGSLLDHLYQGQSDSTAKIEKTRTRFVSRVEAVEGTKVLLERTLRTDLDPRWNAWVRIFAPSVTEVGIEDLTFEFPVVPYRGHFQEDGYNAIAFSGAADCWVRNVRVVNADSGPFLNGSMFVTLDGLRFEAARPPDRNGDTGHHGVTLGDDNLLTNFDFRCRFIHDISVEGTGGGVVSRGRGVDLSFDHHKRYPHANLFTDIDLGEGLRLYRCGGGKELGRHSAAWTTFWNLRSRQPVAKFPPGFGPDLMNAVGLNSRDEAVLDEDGLWFEPIPPSALEPPNLHEAQRALRRAAKNPKQ